MKKYVLILVSFLVIGFYSFYFTPKVESVSCTTDLSITLWKGIKNSEVKCLQQTLNEKGFIVSTSGDGSMGLETDYFGDKTYAAVKAFQASNNLVVDGIFGAMSRATLKNLVSLIYPLGCVSSSGYSSLTGEKCDGSQALPTSGGCKTSIGYNPLNGKSCDSTPDVSGISGPLTLNVAEEGTWTVNVTSSASTNLSYTASWGDTPTGALPIPQTSPIFTHSFLTSGTYPLTFSVIDNVNNKSTITNTSLLVSTETLPEVDKIIGPTSLEVNQIGIWTLNTSSKHDTSKFTYSVIWGDESLTYIPTSQSSPIFSHSFSIAGVYNPKFTILDNSTGRSTERKTNINITDIIIVPPPPVPPPPAPIVFSYASDKMGFGINVPFTSDTLRDIVFSDPSKYPSYKIIFEKYNVEHFRFPGGIPTRFFLWDHPELVKQATDALALFYTATGQTEQASIYADYNYTIASDTYTKFLEFAQATGIEPIIQFNPLFYVNNNVVKQIELFKENEVIPLESDRWTKMTNYLNAQMDLTHSYFPGELTWEFGNEDYATLDASTYGLIVNKYADIVHTRYPNDKIIVALTPGEYRTPLKAQWNSDFIAYLVANNVYSKINYFAPHYYYDTQALYDTQQQINDRILSSAMDDFFTSVKLAFPSGVNYKFSITEFAASLHPENQPYYNTQTHAMVLLDTLMKFYKTPEVMSVTKLGLLNFKNAVFYDKAEYRNLSYYNASRQDTDVFSYIPPPTEIYRIFYDNLGGTYLDYQINSNYELLATDRGDAKVIVVLNYNDTAKDVNISQYKSSGGSATYTTYSFNDLKSYDWDYSNNTSNGSLPGDVLTMPKHSFSLIEIPVDVNGLSALSLLSFSLDNKFMLYGIIIILVLIVYLFVSKKRKKE